MTSERNYPDHYKNKPESQRLVNMINNYWNKRGFPWFTAWVEEEVMEVKNGSKVKKERIFTIRSNIKQRCNP
jgi:hypothetical protein